MAEPLKNLYNERYLWLFINAIHKNYKEFPKEKFYNAIFDKEWTNRELKSRMRHIASTLDTFLTQSYPNNIDILISAFQEINYAFYLENMIFQDYVEVYGIDYFETSMKALEEFTINSSSEFAIRRFLIKNETKTLLQMEKWALSENEHLRRLASEGSRPRLPWAISLSSFKKNPQPIIKILETLKNDTSPYVRKSVANSLNDISKENPKRVIELTKKWLKETPESKQLLKHACRTLLKNSNEEVLEIFGFSKKKNLLIKNFSYDKNLKLGEELSFSFDLVNSEELGLLRVEFVLHFLRKNKQHNKKVFQLAQGEYKTNIKSFKKSYSFKKISTRVYYEGVQKLSIIVNGVSLQEVEFKLLPQHI